VLGNGADLARLQPLRPAHARARFGRLPSPSPRCLHPRSLALERRLDRPGAHLQRHPLLLAWRRGRAAIPHRLRHREEPLGRQHLRLRPPVRLLRRPADLPAPRPLLRDPRRAAHARPDDRRRGRADQGVPLDHLPVRRLPDLHRHPHGPAPQRGAAPGAESDRQARPPRHPGHAGVPRPAVLRAAGRGPDGDAALPDAGVGRVHRPRLRGRFDPRDLRGDDRPVHRLHLQRLRDPRPALALLRPARRGQQVPLPEALAGGGPHLRRREDGPERPLQDPGRRLPGRDRHPARRRRHRLALAQPPGGGGRRIPAGVL
ncbi:MAG: Integral membrane protein TerC, partial [uncultured Thermomicrobiales bacterium]